DTRYYRQSNNNKDRYRPQNSRFCQRPDIFAVGVPETPRVGADYRLFAGFLKGSIQEHIGTGAIAEHRALLKHPESGIPAIDPLQITHIRRNVGNGTDVLGNIITAYR